MPLYLFADGNKTKHFDFSCGLLAVTARRSLSLGYIIALEFKLNKEVQLHFDSLSLKHKEKVFPYELNNEKWEVVEDSTFSVIGDTIIYVVLNQNILDESTKLILSMDDVVKCNGVFLKQDDIQFDLIVRF